MIWISQSTNWFIALATFGVCLLIHLIYQRSLRSKQRRIDELDEHNQNLKSDTKKAAHDERISRLENSLLREFLSRPDAKSALRELMKRYVVNPQTDFALYVETGPEGSEIIDWSGLEAESRSRFRIPGEVQHRIAAERVLVLEGSDLFNSPLMEGLSRNDRRKSSSLVCIACDAPSGNPATLITTSFPLERVSRKRQIELSKRLLDCICRHYRQSHVVSAQEDELLIANDVMELRGIADREFTAPVSMAQAVLEHLLGQTGAYRAAYFIASDGSESQPNRLAGVGGSPQANLIKKWEDTEQQLANLAMHKRSFALLDQETLHDQLQIDSFIASALVLPLLKDGQPMGVICLTWQSSKTLNRAEVKLAEWSVSSLADGFARVNKWALATKQSKEDGLTQLVNRRKFDEQLEIEIELAAQSSEPLGLLLLDLDRFKLVNDTFGHQAGDEVLRVTAERLRQEVKKVRGGDRIMLARYGGEELAVLLPKFDTPGANRVAESIRKAIAAEPVTHGDQTIPVTTSIGVAIFPHHAKTGSGLLEFADLGLYEAKERGRNRVCVCSKASATRPRD